MSADELFVLAQAAVEAAERDGTPEAEREAERAVTRWAIQDQIEDPGAW